MEQIDIILYTFQVDKLKTGRESICPFSCPNFKRTIADKSANLCLINWGKQSFFCLNKQATGYHTQKSLDPWLCALIFQLVCHIPINTLII